MLGAGAPPRKPAYDLHVALSGSTDIMQDVASAFVCRQPEYTIYYRRDVQKVLAAGERRWPVRALHATTQHSCHDLQGPIVQEDGRAMS